MYVVTWQFEGVKQSQKYASSGGADAKARLQRRIGCKKVKVTLESALKREVKKKLLDE